MLLGAVGTLQHVVVLGPLVIGPIGAYRAARWWGSQRGRLAALIAYAVVPLPYNALARGHWGGLVAYAAAPWVLAATWPGCPARCPSRSRPGARSPPGWQVWLVIVALVAAVAVSFLYVVPIVGAALLAGSALAGRAGSGLRMLGVSVAASVGAFVLLLPWSGSVLGSSRVALGPSSRPTGPPRLRADAAVRHRAVRAADRWAGPCSWWPPCPLLIGSGWRLAWAARLWLVALAFFWVTWAGLAAGSRRCRRRSAWPRRPRPWPDRPPSGLVAFELDLPGYRFGWRQLAADGGRPGPGRGRRPVLVASGRGRWHLPIA